MKGPPSQDESEKAPSAASELDALDYYTLLGVTEEATRAEIRAAFRRFALRYHPDRFAGQSEALSTRALTIYRRGAEAVDVLCDPQQRKAYDAVLKRGEKRLTDDAVAALRSLEPVVSKKAQQHAAPSAVASAASAAPSAAAPAAPSPASAVGAKPKPAPDVATFSKPGAGVRASRPRPPRASKPSKRAMPAVSPARPNLGSPNEVTAPAAPPARTLRIQSPQARAFFERALDAKAKGDLRAAWRMLKAAVEAEPDNAALESELYAVERHFRP